MIVRQVPGGWSIERRNWALCPCCEAEKENLSKCRMTIIVRPPKQTPMRDSRRPPEPIRPLPARRSGITLLAAKARRARYRRSDFR